MAVVLCHVEEHGLTTSHLVLSRALRPSCVRTCTTYLSWKTLGYCKELAGFHLLSHDTIVGQTKDGALVRYYTALWWLNWAAIIIFSAAMAVPCFAVLLLIAAAAVLVSIPLLCAMVIGHGHG